MPAKTLARKDYISLFDNRFVLDIMWLYEPRDIWVGIYWNKSESGMLKIYVCIVPVLPILICYWRNY